MKPKITLCGINESEIDVLEDSKDMNGENMKEYMSTDHIKHNHENTNYLSIPSYSYEKHSNFSASKKLYIVPREISNYLRIDYTLYILPSTEKSIFALAPVKNNKLYERGVIYLPILNKYITLFTGSIIIPVKSKDIIRLDLIALQSKGYITKESTINYTLL